MAEPAPHERDFGVLAEFDDPHQLLDAVRKTRDAGFRSLDAYTPFPVPGLADALHIRDNRVAWMTLAGGLAGAAAGYGLQIFANLDYPLNVGGRPLLAHTAFSMITFELAILCGALAGIVSMFALNRLPRLHHPLFESPNFHLASDSKFFLIIFGNDPKFDAEACRSFLEGLQPRQVEHLGPAEEPQ